jgi:hypothetical protein
MSIPAMMRIPAVQPCRAVQRCSGKPVAASASSRAATRCAGTHRAGTGRPAATLLDDFWKTVDAVLREKGVIA